MWNNQIEELLEKVRLNSVYRENLHRKNFYYYKSYSKYFQIPLIIISSCNSVISIGLGNYTNQNNVSATTCLLSMLCGIISSIELYLSINSQMEIELKASKDFYSIAINIYKVLHLPVKLRPEDGKEYLNKAYGEYLSLCQSTSLLKQKFKNDNLIYDNIHLDIETNSSNSNSSTINHEDVD
tara:strand:- start:35 stop:580 length:546 start_codon:yes stop_codon:yes gene_type:complete